MNSAVTCIVCGSKEPLHRCPPEKTALPDRAEVTRTTTGYILDPQPDKALHYSADKPGVDQIPPDVLLEWGDIFTYGAKKYARDNWRKGTEWHEFYGSALRHLARFWGGEDIDPETGLPHLVHALWNCGALRYYQLHGVGTDDRATTPQEDK